MSNLLGCRALCVAFCGPLRRNLAGSVHVSRNFGKFVTLDKKNDVALIRLDSPDSKVNVLSKEFSTELFDAVKRIETDSSISSAVFISKKPGCFIAGADIGLLASAPSATKMQELSSEAQAMMMYLETFKKPLVAAIMGSCLGGGLELALACHYRLAVDNKQTILGLPEVKLGLIPGAGGTQRMLAACPAPDQALQLILTGRMVSAPQAKRMGLVHQVISPLGPGLATPTENTQAYLESVAVSCAQKIASGTLKPSKAPRSLFQKIVWKAMEVETLRRMFFKRAQDAVVKKTHGLYPAPLRAIELLETSITKGPSVGYELESKIFGELAATKESKALISLFFGHTECKKQRLPAPKQPVKRLAVLGAGLMGAGIAQVSIQRGIPTVMKDVNKTNLARGEEYIQSNFQKLIKKKRISPMEADKMFSLLDSTLDFNALRGADLAIEAVFEDLAVKHQVVKDVEAVLPEHAIFASNTSALPICRIADASKRPEKFVGMHYFSPVDKMELLEIITTDKTSPDTLSSAMDLGLRQGKAVIVVRDGPGFYTTRLLAPMLLEAVQLMQEGVSPSELDRATCSFGWPVGLATLADEVGIDVTFHVAEFLSSSFKPRMTGGNIQLLKEMVTVGMLGRKSGKGLFLYSGGKSASRIENPEAQSLIERFRLTPKAENTPQQIQFRLFSRFVNEAVLCLQDGILMNGPVEGDIGAVFGLGFPPRLGGPFRYLDIYGATNLVQRMEEFRTLYGDQFTPCPLLLEHAKHASKRFHQ